MATLYVRDVPEDMMARLRERAEQAHQSVQGYVRSLLDRDMQMLTVEEAVARSRDIAAGSGISADDVIAAIEEDRTDRG